MTARRSLVMWVVDGCSKNLHETMSKSKQSAQPLQSIQSIRPIGLECHTERADQEETHRQIAPLPFPPKNPPSGSVVQSELLNAALPIL